MDYFRRKEIYAYYIYFRWKKAMALSDFYQYQFTSNTNEMRGTSIIP